METVAQGPVVPKACTTHTQDDNNDACQFKAGLPTRICKSWCSCQILPRRLVPAKGLHKRMHDGQYRHSVLFFEEPSQKLPSTITACICILQKTAKLLASLVGRVYDRTLDHTGLQIAPLVVAVSKVCIELRRQIAAMAQTCLPAKARERPPLLSSRC